MSEATRDEQIVWLTEWAGRNGCTLTLEGHCGIGRECVGILAGSNYPDYDYDGPAAAVAPPDAYHKHDCLAVLGRGDRALQQLYAWVRAIDGQGGRIEHGYRRPDGAIDAMLLGFRTAAVVFGSEEPAEDDTSDLAYEGEEPPF